MLNKADHLVHGFDKELGDLGALLVDMALHVDRQMETALQALDLGDMALAKQVVQNDEYVDDLEVKVDAAVLNLLAKRSPLASDLRMILATSKISVELEKIGNQIADFAALVAYLFSPETSNPNHTLLQEILKFGNMIKVMLDKLIPLLQKNERISAEDIANCDQYCQDEFREGIKQQLDFAVKDARRIGRALTLMRMMKDLEDCGEHCCHIAEYFQNFD